MVGLPLTFLIGGPLIVVLVLAICTNDQAPQRGVLMPIRRQSLRELSVQADISLHRGIADDHLEALIETARRRALEPILLEDVDVEVSTTTPSTT